MAINVERTEQFMEILRESSTKLVVVDFYSETCPPCLVVDRILTELTRLYPLVAFYKVNIKNFSEVAMQCRITATPTLQFFRNGRSVREVKGANRTAIVDAIDSCLRDSSTERATAFGVIGHSDLTSCVLKTQSECLNQNDDHPLDNVFDDTDLYLESDVDEQLVLHVSFNQAIKLHSIMLKASGDRAPKSIKLFVNRTDVGFDDAESAEATQEIEMSADVYEKGGVVNLRYVRFQNVNSLTIFVADNLGGDDVTAITQLAFIGTAINGANISDIKQDDGHSH
ncbi:hypothetical protein IW148_004399 [Coemansia sp. RSA 1199]|nr:hypothetical protein IW148_004399 [Coemansia sp. RSA 1199]